MKAMVTSKGQVTIPKALRDQFGIGPGTQVDFVAGEDGIRVRRVVSRERAGSVLGCLKDELQGMGVADAMEELRGPVELPDES